MTAHETESHLQFQTLDSCLVESITKEAELNHADPQLQHRLIKQWPQFRFIVCSEYDMDTNEIELQTENCQFFFMAASLGCASLTRNYEQAIGVIIAIREFE